MLCTAVITTTDTQMRERRVCLYVCLTMVVLGGRFFFFFLAKPLCTICNKQRWDNNIKIYKREAFCCSTVPGFWGLTYSNSLMYMYNRTERTWETIFKKYSSSTFHSASWETCSCHKYCKWECDRKYCWELDDKTQYPCPVPPCSWTTQLPPPPTPQKPWGKIIK